MNVDRATWGRTSIGMVRLLLAALWCGVIAAETPSPGREIPSLDGIVAIKEISRLSWSPDNRWIAFLYSEGSTRTIYVVSPSGGSPRRISAPEGRVSSEFGNTSRLAWSPDSSMIAYVEAGQLHVATLRDFKNVRLTDSAGVESDPQFSPDGKSLVFIRDGEVYTIGADGAKQLRLTNTSKEGWRNFSPSWAPDGSAILFSRSDTRPNADISVMHWDKILVRPTTLKENISKSEIKIGVVPKAGGKIVWLGRSEANIYSLRGGSVAAWSPDGQSIYINRISADQKRRDILIASSRDGDARVLYSERDDRWISPQSRWLQWSPDSRQLLFTSEKTGWNQLYVLDAKTGGVRRLTEGAFTVQSPFEYDTREFSPTWSKDGKKIYFAARIESPFEQHFYAVPSAGGTPERLTANRGFYAAAVVSPNENLIAFLYSTTTNPWELFVMPNRPRAEAVRLTTSVPRELEGFAWINPTLVEFPSKADGRQVNAHLFLPPDLDKTRKHPVIVHVHGEGYLQYVTNGWGAGTGGAHVYPFLQYLAASGYIVLNVDFRGSSGYGRDWRVGVYRELGFVDLDDVLGGIDYLKGLSFADTSRVGIFGRSYGGFMTLMALFRSPETFRVGVADRPVGNWERFYYLAAGYAIERFGAPPQDMREVYMRSSPIAHTKNLKGKVLIIGAMLDLMFPDVTELTMKLTKEKKDFDVMIYPDEPHGFRNAEAMVDVLRRTFEFLEEHLRS